MNESWKEGILNNYRIVKVVELWSMDISVVDLPEGPGANLSPYFGSKEKKSQREEKLAG